MIYFIKRAQFYGSGLICIVLLNLDHHWRTKNLFISHHTNIAIDKPWIKVILKLFRIT